MLEFAEMDAAKEARDCGAMDSTGIRWSCEGLGGFEERKLRTSRCDWAVMRTDSAEVMQPLAESQVRR